MKRTFTAALLMKQMFCVVDFFDLKSDAVSQTAQAEAAGGCQIPLAVVAADHRTHGLLASCADPIPAIRAQFSPIETTPSRLPSVLQAISPKKQTAVANPL